MELSQISETNQNIKKLAFCFMIYNEIENSKIWESFFDGIDKKLYNIYIHRKEKTNNIGIFENYVIPEHIDTKYGDVSLVKCSNLLFKKAYESDQENYKFILLSGTCIPVKNFNYIYDILTKDDTCYIHYWDIPRNHQNLPRLSKYIKREFIRQHSQWVILNREAVSYIKHNPLIHYFKHLWAPDEFYYGTMFEIIQNDLDIYSALYRNHDDNTTFVHWDNIRNYPFVSKHNGLKNYSKVSSDEFLYLFNKKPFPLFARKFLKNFKIKN